MKNFILLKALFWMLFIFFNQQLTYLHASEIVNLTSPNKRIALSLTVKEKLEPFPQGKRLYYSVYFDGKNIILDSPLGIDFKHEPPIARDLIIGDVEDKVINQNWKRVWGKNKIVLDNCTELAINLQESGSLQRKIKLIIRAYDDGVAFRYFLPEQENLNEFNLSDERSEFHFAGNHKVWAANYNGFVSHQEAQFQEMKLNQILPSEIYGLPLLIQLNDKMWVAITESNLTDWAGMYLTGKADQPYALVTRLSPRQDDPSILVKSKTPRYSPWRTIMIAENPGDLIESNIIANLNEPCALKDVSWIKPGKSAWDRWWSGSYAPDADFEVGVNTESMKYFVDFAAEMGWTYQLVDWTWYGPPFEETSDITTPNPELDIQELFSYAKKKGIKLLLWLDWNLANKQMDKAFPLYEKWGAAGVKIDFMQRDDQEMVNFYHRVVKKAAEHHLTVDFHGAYKPTGWSRTYPNVITREGVLGNEHTKWSNNVTPDHCLTLPFTRGLCGEMDFTPGGFRHTTKETFKVVGSDAPGPFVMGTRCFQLAMMVVYESVLQVLCDSPYNYRQSPAGLDFLKIVPTTWDETKVLHAQVGDFITIARRSGKEWYIGSMTDWDERELKIPLNFLAEGNYMAQIWADAPEANEFPERVRETQQTVTAKEIISIKLASGGGNVIYIKPM